MTDEDEAHRRWVQASANPLDFIENYQVDFCSARAGEPRKEIALTSMHSFFLPFAQRKGLKKMSHKILIVVIIVLSILFIGGGCFRFVQLPFLTLLRCGSFILCFPVRRVPQRASACGSCLPRAS